MTNKLYPVRQIRDFRDLLQQSAELFAENTAFRVRTDKGKFKSITYGQFKEDVDALGAALVSMGLSGGFAAVVGENRYEWCVSYLAITCHAGVVVPLDKELPVAEKAHLLARSGVRILIFSERYTDEIRALKNTGSDVEYFITMDSVDGNNTNADSNITKDGFLSFRKLIKKGRCLIENKKYDPKNHQIDENALSVLLFTSGTTDLAKGVMLSQKNICSNIMAVSKTVYVDENASVLSILPLHHTYECTIGFLTIIYSGGTIAFNEGLKHIRKNLAEIKPSILVSVPLLLENMHKRIWDQACKKPGMKSLLKIMMAAGSILEHLVPGISRRMFGTVHRSFGGNLKLIITGAAAIEPKVVKNLEKMGLKVFQGYGLTECSPLVIGERDYFHGSGSVGFPLPGVDVKIVDPDSNGIGEIITRGENVMLGYYKNKEATDRCIRNGWFHTGDLGRIGKKGAYYITGRLKNVIVTKNGKNIFPEEVESYINRSPYVLESMVVGFEDEESRKTTVSAHILPNLEAIKEKLKVNAPTIEEIKKIISETIKNANRDMPLYKRISKFTIKDSEFVKTTTMKIKRYAENTELRLEE